VLCTSLDPQQERVNGIAAGADDFIGKPINQPELFARVQSLLRIKRLHDETQRQAGQLAAMERRRSSARRREGRGERALSRSSASSRQARRD
jgi:DNA-binding response OmpR family regulator